MTASAVTAMRRLTAALVCVAWLHASPASTALESHERAARRPLGLTSHVAAASKSGAAGGSLQVGARTGDSTSGLPTTASSLKIAVLGDFGTASKAQYRLAERMAAVHQKFPFELVTLVGDNIYGADRPQDFRNKFEKPYAPLLAAGVKFYGSLGNHDSREQRLYKLFNMEGELYYSFKAPKQDVRFIALESTYLDPEQVKWLEDTLRSAREAWKIVYFHHPLYSSGTRHGSDQRLRVLLEPLFVKYGVSVVFSGHDHIYERSKPQQGIVYFIAGSGGQLRRGGALPNQPFSAKVVDDTNVFLAAEIEGDSLWFEAIATDGRVVDSGQLSRRALAAANPTTASNGDGRR